MTKCTLRKYIIRITKLDSDSKTQSIFVSGPAETVRDRATTTTVLSQMETSAPYVMLKVVGEASAALSKTRACVAQMKPPTMMPRRRGGSLWTRHAASGAANRPPASNASTKGR